MFMSIIIYKCSAARPSTLQTLPLLRHFSTFTISKSLLSTDIFTIKLSLSILNNVNPFVRILHTHTYGFVERLIGLILLLSHISINCHIHTQHSADLPTLVQ